MGKHLIRMDYFGYHLAPTYQELTPMQAMFLDYGRSKLEEQMNGGDNKKDMKKYSNMRRR